MSRSSVWPFRPWLCFFLTQKTEERYGRVLGFEAVMQANGEEDEMHSLLKSQPRSGNQGVQARACFANCARRKQHLLLRRSAAATIGFRAHKSSAKAAHNAATLNLAA